MAYVLIFNLIPKSPIYPQFLTGRHLHALFLTLVISVDRELGIYLHDSKTVQISKNHFPIHKLQSQHQEVISTGTPCWYQISLLDDALFGKLTQLWLNLNPQHPWHLGSVDLYITEK